MGLGLYVALLIIRRLRHERDSLIHQKEVVFGFIHDVGEVFAQSDEIDLDRMLKRILFYALRTTRAGAGALYLEDAEGRLRARAVSGLFPPLSVKQGHDLEQAMSKAKYVEQLVRAEVILRDDGLVGEVAETASPILIEDAERDPRVPKYARDFFGIDSILLVPMRFLQKVLGVLVVVNRVDSRPFTQGDLSLLQALADQASVSVHYAGMRDSLDEKQRLDHDLSVARQIQTALLPKAIPNIPGLELAAFNLPAQQIGGDYYDFLCIDAEHIGIAIADVSGKGVVGAIMMSISRSVLRAHAAASLDPAEVLKAVNRVMFEDIAEDMFVSMLYMVLNIRTRELVVARAGHERPAWSQGAQRTFTIIDSPGLALGIADQETFEATLETVTVQLNPGDVVVAYTDGITEAMNTEGEEWGIDRFLDAVNISAPEGAHSVLNNVQQRLLRFVGDVGQYDDMTLLAIRMVG